MLLSPQLKRIAALAAWFVPAAFLVMGTALPRVLRPTAMPSLTDAPISASQAGSSPQLSTSSLFTYRRNDTSPGGVTRIHIDVRRKATVAIHSDVFGNFIEHLGGVVYGGLWSQLLLNPNLEAIENPSEGRSAPPEWRANRQALWRPGGKELHGYHSPGYVSLLAGGASEPGRLYQTIWLPIHRVSTYVGTIALRSVPDVDASPEKPPVPAAVRIALTADESRGPIYAETTVEAGASDWSVTRLKLTVSAGTLAGGTRVRLLIENAGDSTVDVDRIELFPADNDQGADPEVLAKARDWHIPVLRWPGGNFASGYHWQDGVGDRAQRPTRRNAAWGDVESNEFGTDEFLAYCRRLGAKPQLTVNAGDGTPEEAAAWVRYCNSGENDRFGRLRRSIGRRTPYNVRLWEVGNELYGDWQIGHAAAEENARRFVRFRAAMLGADPGLRLIATGKADEFLPAGLARNSAWNQALLSAAVRDGGRPPDFLSIHPLVPLPADLQGLSYSSQYESAMAHPAFLDRTLIPDLWSQIRGVTGPDTPTRIAITEWGLIVGGDRWQEGPNHDTMAGAVYNGLCLNIMLRHSDCITLANMTAFMHGGGIKKPGGRVIVDPQYFTQKLYAEANLQTPVATETTGPGMDVPSRGFLPGVDDVPDVDVFAALDRSGRRLALCAVNRRETVERTIEVSLNGFRPTRADSTLLSAPSAKTRNTAAEPNACAPQSRSVPLSIADGQSILRMTLAPHSVSVIVFREAR